MTNPTDPRVEAAARALFLAATKWDCDFDDLGEIPKKQLLVDAQIIIEAADEAAWQPIETAPLHQEIIIAWKTGTVSVGTKYGTGWKFSNGDEMYGVHAASGWQPLPKSP